MSTVSKITNRKAVAAITLTTDRALVSATATIVTKEPQSVEKMPPPPPRCFPKTVTFGPNSLSDLLPSMLAEPLPPDDPSEMHPQDEGHACLVRRPRSSSCVVVTTAETIQPSVQRPRSLSCEHSVVPASSAMNITSTTSSHGCETIVEEMVCEEEEAEGLEESPDAMSINFHLNLQSG
jgi:hypothetical protein